MGRFAVGLVVFETKLFQTLPFVFFHSSDALVVGVDGLVRAIFVDIVLAGEWGEFDCGADLGCGCGA